jgi:hypothetical protein
MFKWDMLKRGYLVKNLRERKIILVDAVTAWARKKGIDYKKRVEIQNRIDKMKEPKTITILPKKYR